MAKTKEHLDAIVLLHAVKMDTHLRGLHRYLRLGVVPINAQNLVANVNPLCGADLISVVYLNLTSRFPEDLFDDQPPCP